MIWKSFPDNWTFVRRIHWLPVDILHIQPVMQSFDISFVVSLNKMLNNSHALSVIWDIVMVMWHHCNSKFWPIWIFAHVISYNTGSNGPYLIVTGIDLSPSQEHPSCSSLFLPPSLFSSPSLPLIPMSMTWLHLEIYSSILGNYKLD